MQQVQMIDYVCVLDTLFETFWQQQNNRSRRGHPFDYSHKSLIVFFLKMQCFRIFAFKAQIRWLQGHRSQLTVLGISQVPHRTTLSRRYKSLYPVLQSFVCFIGLYARDLDLSFSAYVICCDKSLFKAAGSVWHQSDRANGVIPKGLRALDPDATWCKSAYHGWVYGYGLHLICSEGGFPLYVQAETASVSESQVTDEQEVYILEALNPQAVLADGAYTKALRIRAWAKEDVLLLVPAHLWKNGRYAEAYHRYIEQPEQKLLYKSRRKIEPIFDLLAKLIDATDNHKQVSIKGLANVRSCLALATLSLQLSMIVNTAWGMPLHNISSMLTAFT